MVTSQSLSRGQLREGTAAQLYGTLPPVRLRLRKWFGSRELRRRATTPQDALAPAEHVRRLGAGQRLAQPPRRTLDHDEDPPIPYDFNGPDYKAVFGSADDDTPPLEVTPIEEARSWLRRPSDGRRPP